MEKITIKFIKEKLEESTISIKLNKSSELSKYINSIITVINYGNNNLGIRSTLNDINEDKEITLYDVLNLIEEQKNFEYSIENTPMIVYYDESTNEWRDEKIQNPKD